MYGTHVDRPGRSAWGYSLGAAIIIGVCIKVIGLISARCCSGSSSIVVFCVLAETGPVLSHIPDNGVSLLPRIRGDVSPREERLDPVDLRV